jgi:hypothetical protein
MKHWTNALVAAVTGVIAATGASAQQHVLNMLVLSEDAPKIQKGIVKANKYRPFSTSKLAERRGNS